MERWLRVRGRFRAEWAPPWLLRVAATAAMVVAAAVSWPGPAGQAARLAGQLLIGAWPALVLLAAAALLWGIAARRHAATHQHDMRQAVDDGELRWPWLVSDRGVLTVAAAVAAVGVAALVAMWQIAEQVPPTERGKVQIDAIKYGLGFFAAAGAAAALLLSLRRQQLAEHTHRLELRKYTHTEVDAAARRVTELYSKAVEQLGADDAAVRLGGLYALERVAEDNPEHRQTIVNVICAYLRMPYTSPDASVTADGPRDAHQELQVRLAAQHILTTHLRPAPEQETPVAWPRQPSLWTDIDLDLTGAYLIDWNLAAGRLRSSTFTKATFAGDASFNGVAFSGDARFGKATFTGDAWFDEATFRGDAMFGDATFAGRAWFRATTFTRDAQFDASFSGMAAFSKAAFRGPALFGAVAFHSDGSFDEAAFSGAARFDGATFAGAAGFDGATFSTEAVFESTVFSAGAWFGGATFSDTARFRAATFVADAWFGETTFVGDARFDRATFVRPPQLGRAKAISRDGRRDSWPAGWRAASRTGGQLEFDDPADEDRSA